jgi:hypothetical protein
MQPIDYDISTDVTFHDGNRIVYEAENTISVASNNSSVILESGSDVSLKAGNSITLLPGFSIQSGANFKASIDNDICSTPSSVRKYNSDDNDSEIIDNNDKLSIFAKQNVVSAFPNPAHDYITFYFNITSAIESLTIQDINGRLFSVTALSGLETNKWNSVRLDISAFPEGIYFYTIKHKNGYEKSKFIKQN